MIITWHIQAGEIESVLLKYLPTVEKTEAVAVFMHQQVKRRFLTQGASSGIPWQHKWLKAIGADDGRAILTGMTGGFLESFFGYGEPDAAVVASDSPQSYVNEVGQIGKGGLLPDTVPVKAKALFIPISDRAQKSELRGKTRVATSGRSLKGMPGLYPPLIRGRLYKGQLQRWDEDKGRYVNGKPDFIFLMRVSRPKRPCLPTSEAEVNEAVEFAKDVMMNRES